MARKAATKSARKTTKRSPKKSAKKLSKKQVAQRKYAATVKTIRKRAKKTAGGTGPIADRPAATAARKKLGLKPGKKR
jgi:hypothetical protein